MELTVGEAAEADGLVSPDAAVPRGRRAGRSGAGVASGYRVYGLRELNRLRSLRELRSCFGVELSDLAFAARLRREPGLRDAVHTWLAGGESALEWEQRKHERLLVVA